ncbi:MAG TPA: helix-turn-helix transcriptional regulator, partial [candidate division Zixibacteria bacterium]|nr:helix-turn-helix transcriptional regulator [candidate division Zixibacteria bacterium]
RDRHGAIRGILTSGIDITERRRMEEEMQRIYEQLEHEHDALQKKNIALREVLGQIEGEKDAIKRLVVANIESDIVPTVQRLRGMASEPQGPLLDLLEDSLAHIASEFAAGLKERFHGLTPRQVQICRLIKNGYSSKEIAESIGTSLLTVHKHREAIRDKLGLKNRNISLNSYLQTL